MRRELNLSQSARRTAEALPKAQSDEFSTICDLLEDALIALERGGLVSPYEFYGIEGFRYFDNTFPFFIFFEVVNDAKSEREGLLIHLLLPAQLRPPTQGRI